MSGTTKRRSRILDIQKRNMVSLIENFFIRTVGHHSEVNFNDINPMNWQQIALILNTLGPPKSTDQWKNSFYHMTNRIRKHMKNNRERGVHPRDNMTPLDLRIYKMLPKENYQIGDVFIDAQSSNVKENELGAQSFTVKRQDEDEVDETLAPPENSANVLVVQTPEELDAFISDTFIDVCVENSEPSSAANDGFDVIDSINQHNIDYRPVLQQIDESEVEDITENVSSRPSTTMPQIDSISSLIESCVQNVKNQLISESFRNIAVASDRRTESRSSFIDTIVGNRTGEQLVESNQHCIEETDEISQVCVEDTHLPSATIHCSDSGSSFIESNVRNVNFELEEQMDPSVPENCFEVVNSNSHPIGNGSQIRPVKAAHAQKSTPNPPKPNNQIAPANHVVRIPEVQKERLVQLVQNNFRKAFGPFAGSNGKSLKSQLWKKMAEELNTLGPPRTPDQWKATFDYIKAGAKAKLADSHNSIDGKPRKPLTRLEEKIVSIYGMDNLDGNQNMGEGGFHYEETVPTTRRQVSASPNIRTDDDDELRDVIREIWDEMDGNESDDAQGESDANVSGPSSSAPPTGQRTAANVSGPSSSAHPTGQRTGANNSNMAGATEQVVERNPGSSTCVPPRARYYKRQNRNTTEIQYVSNVNQLFRDGGDDDDAYGTPGSNRGRNATRSNRNDEGNSAPSGNNNRDRSNLRNHHTSYEQVQSSMSAQDRFIDDSNRNHSEMVYLTNRNYLETVGMFTSALNAFTGAFTDLARELINRTS